MWFVEKIEISGGFLPGLSVNIPSGPDLHHWATRQRKINARRSIKVRGLRRCQLRQSRVLTSFRRTSRVGLS